MDLKQDGQTQGTFIEPSEQSDWGNFPGEEEQGNRPYPAMKEKLTLKEFYHHPAMSKCRANILGCCIALYICCAATFAVNILLIKNIAGILDVLLMLGLTLGVHFGKSRVCSIIILIYALFNLVYMLATTGQRGGSFIVLCGIYAVIETFKFQKAWKQYKKTGSYPGIG